MGTPPTPHLEASLQRDIDVIRAKLLEMLALDEQALTRAYQAFLKRDRQLAYSVILCDQDIDAFETELDRLCLEFIMRHQPVAAHLRFIYSASKVISQLERVGDYAESIARQVLLMSSASFEIPTEQFSKLANLAIPMLHNAVRAFVDKNPDLARTTMVNEPRVNLVRDSINSELIEWRHEGRLPLEALAPLSTVARRFERVSDQATNICEEALYYATGAYVRHMPAEGFRVLFVDETNGCLSRMSEALGASMEAKRFSFESAGLTAGPVDPRTIWFLSEKGFDISHQAPRSVNEVPQLEQFQIVIALTQEAEKAFPPKSAKTLGLRWMVPDPSKAHGSPDEVRADYERAYQLLSTHIRDLVEAILGNHRNPLNDNADTPQ